MFVDRFRIVTRRDPGGGYTWWAQRYDRAVAVALGEERGWVNLPGRNVIGHVELRGDAEAIGRKAVDEWVYREANPDEAFVEFEVERGTP